MASSTMNGSGNPPVPGGGTAAPPAPAPPLTDDEPEDMFLEEVPDFLKCAICLCVLKNPYQTPCGHRFCLECIKPVINSRNNVCPNDRTEITFNNTFPDNAVRLQINNLKIKCPNGGCDWKGSYSDKSLHLNKCPHSRMTCELCGATLLKADLQAHQTEVCPQAKVKCEHCKLEVARSDLKRHLGDCLEYQVHCQYGCTDQLFLRRQLSAHYAECTLVPVPCSMRSFGCTDTVIRSKMAEHMMKCAPQRAAKMAETILQLQARLEQLETLQNNRSSIVNDLESTLYPLSGQFTWKITNITGRIKSAQAGDPASSVIYSPAFYSGEGGYKLCLCVYPAGDHNQGFLSLYFVVMKGQFDEILQWPFQRRVFLSLLNCRARGVHSVTKDIHPDPHLHYFFRPEGERNVGYGFPKFIALPKLQLEDSEFVENDSIFFRCSVFGATN